MDTNPGLPWHALRVLLVLAAGVAIVSCGGPSPSDAPYPAPMPFQPPPPLAPSGAPQPLVRLASGVVSEESDRWSVDVFVDFGQFVSDTVRLDVRVRQKVVYERALLEANQPPVVRPIPRDQPPSVERVVASLRTIEGAPLRAAWVRVVLTRARGYEAGEVELVVAPTGGTGTLGAPQPLVLQGLNRVIDRRPLIFHR